MDAEQLLDRRARAGLPFARQLLLYLDPFSLFQDASRGAASQKQRALQYNRAMRGMLLAYVRRWLTIAAGSFACIAPAEALAAQAAVFIVPAAAFAVGCCAALTVTACTLAAYLLLSSPHRP